MKFVDGQKGATGAEGFLLEAASLPSADCRQFAVAMRQMRRDRWEVGVTSPSRPVASTGRHARRPPER